MNVDGDSLRSIVAHFAHLRASYPDALAAPELVEPNGSYFPDEFARDAESVARFFGRMATYAPVAAGLALGVAFVEGEGAAGGCSSGACGGGGATTTQIAVETDAGYAAIVEASTAGDATMLAGSLARSLGRIVLFEAGEAVGARDEGALSELTAIASGLGVLLLAASCVYKKGCGGIRRHEGTVLGTSELALALALFVRVTEAKPGIARRHLGPTPLEAFDEALAWVDTQPSLVRALRQHPETLEDGVFKLEEKKGLLARLFARTDEMPAIDAPRPAPRVRTEEENRRLAEARALVEDALGE